MLDRKPIKCPNCQFEVVPHETYKQRLSDCLSAKYVVEKLLGIRDEIQQKVPTDPIPLTEVFRAAAEIMRTYYVELNDFEISENIERSRMRTTQYIAKTKRDNIDRMNK